MNDDAELIQECLSGRSAAFGSLVQKYQDRLYNTIVHVSGSRDDASDIVQEAFVQAFLKLETFQQSSAFYTWLYRIAFNVAITHHRRRRPLGSLDHLREQSGQEVVDRSGGPVEALERTERVGQIREAIAALGDEHRSVLVLREIEGCCYETIADILQIPVGTVRSRLHRARAELREQLREMLPIDKP